MNRLKYVALAALVAVATNAGPPALAAPLGYTGGTITEDFDTLPTNVTNPAQTGLPKTAFDLNPAINNLSDLTGWQGNNQTGTSATSEFRAHDGSLSGSGGRGLLSYGTNGSTERALGSLPTSNQINRFGLVLVNNSLDTYGSFDLSYVGEQWRRGEPGVTNTMTFAYGMAANIDAVLTSVGALSFANPNNQAAPTEVALDGNLAGNQVSVSGSVVGLTWGPGQTLVLRWAMSEGSGQDNGMGIDDFEFTANVIPEPATWTMASLGLLALAGYGLRRRRS
jgi:MYXO-CTERM domain-containing protein